MKMVLSLFLMVCFVLSGAEQAPIVEGEIEVYRNKWEKNSGVKQLFETPLGAVYKFTNSANFGLGPRSEKHGPKCNCADCRRSSFRINGMLQVSYLRSSQKEKRFVVLDFAVRNFPALTRKGTAEFQFQLVRSAKDRIASDYYDLNGLLKFTSDGYPRFSTTYRSYFQPGLLKDIDDFRAQFEPFYFRIVFDRRSGNHFMLQNLLRLDTILVERPLPPRKKPIEIRSFGIISQNIGDRYQDNYLEISDPVIYQFDSSANLTKLPQITFTPYPYDGYENIIAPQKQNYSEEQRLRKVRQQRNPDLWYAEALRLLYGGMNIGNAEAAVDLLKKASGEDHVLANYHLGICYYRGYGVAPDYEKALHFLKKARFFDYWPATALYAQVLWNREHRPLFMTRELRDELKKLLQKQCFYLQALANILMPAIPNQFFVIAFTPKMLGGNGTLFKLVSKTVRKDGTREDFIDYLISREYIPAYLYKAQLIRGFLGNPEARMNSLRAGNRAGDLECTAEYIWELARRGELTEQEFSAQRALQMADDPVYLFFDFMMKNPGIPGMAEYLQNHHETAWGIWRKRRDMVGEYLLGLSIWMDVYPAQFRHDTIERSKMRTTEDGHGEFLGDVGFEHLKRAAEGGMAAAQYLVGRQYFFEDLPLRERTTGSYTNQARIWLTKAHRNGYPRAAYFLARLEMASTPIDRRRVLELLEPLCLAKYAPAVLLKGQLLDQANLVAEARTAYKTAAALGQHAAYLELAMQARRLKDDAGARYYWSAFIQADVQYRMLDRYDDYWPDFEINKWLMLQYVPSDWD